MTFTAPAKGGVRQRISPSKASKTRLDAVVMTVLRLDITVTAYGLDWLGTVIVYAGFGNGPPWPLFRAQINLSKNENSK